MLVVLRVWEVKGVWEIRTFGAWSVYSSISIGPMVVSRSTFCTMFAVCKVDKVGLYVSIY